MTSLLRFSLVLVAIGISCSDRSNLPPVSSPVTSEAKLSREFKRGEFLKDSAHFAPTKRRDFAVKSYDVKGEFDWNRRELLATVEMKIKLSCACQESFVVDSQVDEIKSIRLRNTGQALGFSVEGRNLAIDISKVPEEIRKQEMSVLIAYRAKSNIRGNGDPTNLLAVDKLPGDPIQSKIVFTFSEPQDASFWMPCLNDPAYRAQFSMELRMPVEQTLISNGDLVRNEVEGNYRWVKYQTRYTLPTYLMAFAQGELSVSTVQHGKLPVSIVSRTGLKADVQGLLKETVRQIQHFEKLLVPYPFEKYMIVLVPEFPSGGIEHAGITFNEETASSQSRLSRDIGLMSHELAHQWFGDLVTVQTWDDLWIKEGMASLLGEEAMRPYEDPNNTGRLMGHEFGVSDGDAILDTDLKPDDKYTSGPYGRAAWLLTQIRLALGEEAFWGALRKVLIDRRFQNIGTDDFLEYFRPAGGDALVEKAKKAIRAKALPSFKVEKKEGIFNLSLEDKDGALLLPVELNWFTDSGAIENEILAPSGMVTHLTNDVRLLTLDPEDRHPLETFGGWEEVQETVGSMLSPRTGPQLNHFLKLGGHTHQRAMAGKSGLKLAAKDIANVYSRLNSEYAKYDFLKVSCGLAKKAEGAQLEVWKSEISKVLLNPPTLGMPVRGTEGLLASCQDIVRPELFNGLWSQLEAYPSLERSELDFYIASLVPQRTAEGAFKLWSKISTQAPSVRARTVGLQNLVRHLNERTGHATPEGESNLVWKQHFLQLLNGNRTGKFLAILLPAIPSFKSADFMPGLAQVIRSEAYMAWRPAFCAAQEIGKKDAEAKKLFDSALGDPTTLAEAMQSFMKDPKSCHDDEN